MSVTKSTISEKSLFYFLLMAIAVLIVAIYLDYSADMFNEFEYAMAKTLGSMDKVLAVR